jgi:hypothetical protein
MIRASNAPVFIVGCHRSGTSYLYHSILSSGDFAVYRSDSGVWDRVIPMFGDLSVLRNRKRMIKVWLRSKLFRRTGLDAEQIESKILAECRNGGDFLRIVMVEIARIQNVNRWAAWAPDNIFYIPKIKRELPNALFIHIIRDGRDVATVLDKKGWIKPLPGDRRHSLLVAGVYWEWMVRRGREHGRRIGPDYIEVRYEDLISRPHETFALLGNFIGHDLDYDHIKQIGIGTVADPNSTFKVESTFQEGQFNPVGRWKKKLSPFQAEKLENLIGPMLDELSYPREAPNSHSASHLELAILRRLYFSYFDSRLWLKSNTPLGRFASKQPLELIEQS